ncbi:hypothetical protein BYT27DRAFT_6627958 [Phlegmacium glaucopus]|nr:hypothetical protein BYT27DRAFT_6627958 [Phlegmacium glaucopus]
MILIFILGAFGLLWSWQCDFFFFSNNSVTATQKHTSIQLVCQSFIASIRNLCQLSISVYIDGRHCSAGVKTNTKTKKEKR